MKTIYQLEKTGRVKGADIARSLGVSRPTVSVSLKALQEEGYIRVLDDHSVVLTPKGMVIAREIADRNNVLFEMLIDLGVDRETASRDACNMEHAISSESLCALLTLANNRNA